MVRDNLVGNRCDGGVASARPRSLGVKRHNRGLERDDVRTQRYCQDTDQRDTAT